MQVLVSKCCSSLFAYSSLAVSDFYMVFVTMDDLMVKVNCLLNKTHFLKNLLKRGCNNSSAGITSCKNISDDLKLKLFP